MQKISYWKIFSVFLKIGAIALGGGYVILPILDSELVEKRNWMTKEELMDYFALSQSLPGIIAANISMFSGYRLRGKWGALSAMLGVVFVPFWCIVLLASVLSVLMNNSYVQSALWGVGIAVIALITLTIREMWQNSKRNNFFNLIFITALISLLCFHTSPIATILAFTTVGVIYKRLTRGTKDVLP